MEWVFNINSDDHMIFVFNLLIEIEDISYYACVTITVSKKKKKKKIRVGRRESSTELLLLNQRSVQRELGQGHSYQMCWCRMFLEKHPHSKTQSFHLLTRKIESSQNIKVILKFMSHDNLTSFIHALFSEYIPEPFVLNSVSILFLPLFSSRPFLNFIHVCS